MSDVRDQGGDPPCWAHLVEPEAPGPASPVVDLAGRGAGESGAAWSLPHGGDLDANLVWLRPGDEIAPHADDEVDVLVHVVDGGGEVVLDGTARPLAPAAAVLVPKGTVRALRAGPEGLRYLSVHRRRSPLGIEPRGGPGGAVALDRLASVLADAVVVADPGGRITFWNDSAERVFGWPTGEALGRSLDLIIPEPQRQRHWDGYRHVMATGHTRYGTELLRVPAQHRDGRRLSIAFAVSLLTDDTGKVAGIAAVVRDETDRWNEERELRRRLRELEQEG